MFVVVPTNNIWFRLTKAAHEDFGMMHACFSLAATNNNRIIPMDINILSNFMQNHTETVLLQANGFCR